MSTDLITEHLDLWTSAVTYNNGKSRGNNGEPELTGIQKLRELILELAVRGKLVPQDPEDETASKLLERIEEEKWQLYVEGKIKKSKKLPEIGEEEKPFEVPKGWQWVRMGEIQTFFNGLAFKSREFVDDGVGVVRIGDVSWYGKIIPKGMKRFPPEKAEEIEEKFWVRPGDLVITMTGDVKVGFNTTDEHFLLNQRVGKIVLHCVDSRYVFRFLQTVVKEKIQNAFGGVIPNLSTKEINSTLIPLPPLSEQYRIVEKVDELMALCDRLEQQTSDQLSAHETLVDTLLDTLIRSHDAAELADNWGRLAEYFDTLFTTEHSIDRLEQTILQLAVMGRLVPQDPSEEPASKLLERIEEEKVRLYKEGKVKKPKKLPEVTEEEEPFYLPIGWAWSRIGNISLYSEYGSSSKAFYEVEGYPVIKMGDIQNGEVVLGDKKRIPCSEAKVEKLLLERGDILFNRTNSAELVGKTGIYEGPNGEYTFASYLIRIKCPESLVIPRYLNLVMNTPFFREVEVEPHLKQQCGQANVNGTIMKNMQVPIPPYKEQIRIVKKVNELKAVCGRLRRQITETEDTCQRLAESIVKQMVF